MWVTGSFITISYDSTFLPLSLSLSSLCLWLSLQISLLSLSLSLPPPSLPPSLFPPSFQQLHLVNHYSILQFPSLVVESRKHDYIVIPGWENDNVLRLVSYSLTRSCAVCRGLGNRLRFYIFLRPRLAWSSLKCTIVWHCGYTLLGGMTEKFSMDLENLVYS